MSGEERRGKIIQALKNSDKAVSATTLAKEFDVSDRSLCRMLHFFGQMKKYIFDQPGVSDTGR